MADICNSLARRDVIIRAAEAFVGVGSVTETLAAPLDRFGAPGECAQQNSGRAQAHGLVSQYGVGTPSSMQDANMLGDLVFLAFGLVGRGRLQLAVVLRSNVGHEIELRLYEIDVALFVLQQILEQLHRNVVLGGPADFARLHV